MAGKLIVLLLVAGAVVAVVVANVPSDRFKAPAVTPAVATVPDAPDIPHAYSFIPRNEWGPPKEKIEAADRIIARWKQWKAKPTDDVVPFRDYRNARYNLSSIFVTDPEYEAALAKSRELDEFGIALANAEIKVAEKIRARDKTKADLAVLNDTEGRNAYAKRLEDNFLRNGMDARITTEGDKLTTLRIRYIGFTRPTMFKLQEERKLIPDIMEQSKAKGFRKLIMWDGYDNSWAWDLGSR